MMITYPTRTAEIERVESALVSALAGDPAGNLVKVLAEMLVVALKDNGALYAYVAELRGEVEVLKRR